jgi:signal transduction histidine kinase
MTQPPPERAVSEHVREPVGRAREWIRERPRTNPLGGALGRRLIVLFLAFSLVPLVASNMLGYVRSVRIIEDLTKRYLAELGEVEAQHVEGQVARYLLDLQAIAAGNEFLAAGARALAGEKMGQMAGVAEPAAVEQYLRSKLAGLPAFEAFYLQPAADGPMVSTAPGSPAMRAVVEAGRGAATMDRLPVAPGLPPRFHLAVPVVDGSLQLAGYLGGVISTEGLAMLLEIPEHLAGSVESFIVDEVGRPIFVSHPHGEVDLGTRLAAPVLELGPREVVRYEDRNGVEVLGVSVPVEGMSWRYVAEAPVSSALGPLVTLRRVSLILAVVFALLVLAAAWLVTGGIVAPVRRLVTATRRVGGGDLSARVAVEGRDEIGELAGAFNEMTAELADASARVEELHRREIERAQQLATVGELASGVAHEIKNPLVGISNGLDLVMRRVGDDPALAPIANEMTHQLQRIEAAIRDLLAYARPRDPQRAPTDVNRVVRRVATLVAPAAEHLGVRVLTDLGPAVPDVPADEELIRQALVNLLMNAVQASPPEADVGIRTTVGPDGAEIDVWDRGRGIAHRDKDHIFKPFYTTRHSGTGLGLSITREIVDRHGGRLEVESEVGKGSTFRIVLPLEVRQAAGSGKTGGPA